MQTTPLSDAAVLSKTRRPGRLAVRRAPGPRLCAVLALTLVLAGCGESKQAKAEKSVCKAKTEIQAKVDHLKTITPSLTTLPEIKREVTAIVDDLKTIDGAQSELNPSRRKQIEQATAQFGEKVKSAISNIVPSLNLASVEAQLKSAVTSLVSSYAQALAPVQCA